MGTKLVVITGSARGQEFWVETDFVRLGSGADCDVSQPDPALAPHAATLEWRDNRYHLYNRGDAVITLAGRPLANGQSAMWMPNQDLRLTNDLSLRLQCEGNPAPSPKPANLAGPAGSPAAMAAIDEAKAKASARNMQVAVLLICAVLVAVMLLTNNQSGPTAVSTATIDQLVSRMEKEKKDWNVLLTTALLTARREESKENWLGAAVSYAIIRDNLVVDKINAPHLFLYDSVIPQKGYTEDERRRLELKRDLWVFIVDRLSQVQ